LSASVLSRLRAERDRLSGFLGAQASGRIGPSYALRTVRAALASFAICHLLGVSSPIWSVVSAVVCIMPTHQASVASAGLRVIANLLGSAVGLAVSALGLSPLPSIAIGLPAVAALASLLAIDGAARSASVALVIVSLPGGSSVAGLSERRVAQVMLGCAIAFCITVIGAAIERRLPARWREQR
jgi:uncharacterized membrane protein YgaE (UPF0421/DUF939 family)